MPGRSTGKIMNYRDTASFGKRQEFVVIAELLKHGFDVYLTLVDDQGIDCVVRLNETKYLDIQIKARSKSAKHGHTFAAMTFDPRPNLFFIFYTEINDTFWTIPSEDLAKICSQNKSGKNAGKRTFILPKKNTGEKAERFHKYKNENGFKLLK